MSLYNDASLVLIPSGFKTSVLFSQKPTDGTGDLTFTRSLATATRVGPDGLIEKVRTNLLLQSNGFNTASWNKSGAGTGLAPVVTANAGIAPDGTNTALRVQFNCVGSLNADRSILNQGKTTTNSTPHASSIFIKAFSVGEVGKQVRFITEFSSAAIIITLTSDYQRVINVGTSTSTSINFLLETRGAVTANTTADVLLAFAQLETGDIATPYIPTTTAAVSVGMLANVPRLDYTGGGCPKLLLEPQRTNLNLFSEQINNAVYTKLNVTIAPNVATSPAGFLDADRLVPNSGAVLSSISNNAQQGFSKAASALVFTYSAFAKEGGLNRFSIIAQGTSVANNASVTFSLTDGSIAVAAVAAGGFSAVSATSTDYGNGWYRFTLSFTTNTDATMVIRNIATDSTITTGDAVKGILLYGIQLEQASYATSYIPTLGAAVTRSADSASKTGISALIGQTEGTLFFEVDDYNFTPNNISPYIEIFTDADNRIVIAKNTANQYQAVVRTLGVTVVNLLTTSFLGKTKIAFGYKENDCVLYVNGNLAGTDTTATIPTCNSIFLGQSITGTILLKDEINSALLFKTRLTNAQLEELTA